jgi:hypothetical protein
LAYPLYLTISLHKKEKKTFNLKKKDMKSSEKFKIKKKLEMNLLNLKEDKLIENIFPFNKK